VSRICKENGMDLVLLSTPTTPIERMTKIAEVRRCRVKPMLRAPVLSHWY